jgi:hypothetical protein
MSNASLLRGRRWIVTIPPETTPLLVPPLGLPADPRPLQPLSLPGEVDPDDPELPLVEGVHLLYVSGLAIWQDSN